MKHISTILNNSGNIKQLAQKVRNKTDAVVVGAGDSQKRHIAHIISEISEMKGIYVAWNEMQAKQAYSDLSYLTDGNALFVPNREIMLYDVEARSFEQTYERISSLVKILEGRYKFIVTSAEALMHFLMPPADFKKRLVTLEPGQMIESNDLERQLLEMGYHREEKVEGRGQYARRGGILDIYPVNSELPCRIEFFDIEVDSMRWFSPEDQRSVGPCEALEIYPAREIVYSADEIPEIARKINNALKKTMDSVSSEIKPLLQKNIAGYIDKLQDSHYFTGVDKFIPYLIDEKATLFDYISDNHVIFFEDSEKTCERTKNVQEELNNLCEILLEKGSILNGTFSMLHDLDTLVDKARKHSIVTLEALDEGSSITGLSAYKVYINGSSITPYNGRLDLLVEDIKKYIEDDYRILVLCSTNERTQRFLDEVRKKDITAATVNEGEPWPEGIPVLVEEGNLRTGFIYKDEKIAVLAESDILYTHVQKRRHKAFEKGKRIYSFTDLKPGDYVVHQAHGIGIYNGIEQLVVEGIRKDYLKISYKDGGVLYIPTTNMDLIQKYIGSEGREPRIHKLGGTEWVKTKTRVKESLRELAQNLIRIQAERQSMKGHAFSPDTVWQKQFEDAFPYEETPDQLKCIEEIKQDMESETVMDRLLCGDVGYGKTEVALRAVFKALMDGKQAAFLVPTTVLAFQHFENFKVRFAGFPVRVEMLSRFRTDSEQRAIIKDLKAGKIDVLIGTHMMLSESVKFKDLGLLVIDEEHRFGVEHKETIKARYPKVDILTLSATPIPRTLNMSLSGLRDISILEDPPENRYPVQTYVMEYRDDIVRDAIHREMSRGGQVFYLFNKVRGIQTKMLQIQSLVPEARVSYAHGQMSERELEQILQAFADREFDVLVCTTIIESGIDMPNVNTIIVEDADRLGLAQLYQLRGRVGRSNRLAYAFLTYKRDKVLNEIAEKRLKAIKEFTEFGSGFKIAMRDLQIRGAGNLLGPEQHGHMESVGYDMYLKLLDEAVSELKGEHVSEAVVDTAIEFKANAYIDTTYIQDETERIDMYRTISAIESEEEILDIKDELIDRFGDIPEEVLMLIEIAYIKNLAVKLGFSSIKEMDDMVMLSFASQDSIPLNRIGDLIVKWKGKIMFSAGKQPYLSLRIKNEKCINIINNVKILLQDLQKLKLEA